MSSSSPEHVTIKSQALRLAVALPLWCSSFVLPASLSGSGWASVRAEIAKHLMENSRDPLDEWLPRLRLAKQPLTAIDSLPADVSRPSSTVLNALRNACSSREGYDWSDLAALSVDELQAIPGIDRSFVVELLHTLIDLGITPQLRISAPSNDISEPSYRESRNPLGSKESTLRGGAEKLQAANAESHSASDSFTLRVKELLDELGESIATILRWSVAEKGRDELLEAVELARSAAAPEDIRATARKLQRRIAPETEIDLEKLLEQLREQIDPRGWDIISERVFQPQGRTLEDIGIERDLTRERVRQIEAKALKRMLKLLQAKRMAPLHWRAHSIATQLGTAYAANDTRADDLLVQLLGDDRSELFGNFMRWLAGPYILREGIWWREGLDVQRKLLAQMSSVFGEEGASPDEAREWLAEAGVIPKFADSVLAQLPLHYVMGRFFRTRPGIPQLAVVALRQLDRPAGVEELAELGEFSDRNLRGARQRLMEDPRIMRVSKDEFALREWGLNEYSGIADAIVQAITDAGGITTGAELMKKLPATFGVSTSSVRAYLEAPQFVYEDDTVRLRRRDEPFSVPDTVEQRQGVFRLDNIVSVLVEVSSETLRGSGNPLPADVVQALGVKPGNSRVFQHRDEGFAVSVYWPATGHAGGTLGTVRNVVSHLGAIKGQLLRLTFDVTDSTVDSALVQESWQDPLEGLRNLTGFQLANKTDAEVIMERALGHPFAGAESSLRARGDIAAAELLARIRRL